MTNNKHFERLTAILSRIEENGITRVEELKHTKNKALWDELFFAVQDFINYYALKSKTSKNERRGIVPGNEDKVNFLIKEGGKDLYDIQMEVLLHAVNKMNYILAQSPVSKKTSYLYKVVNNRINDLLRELAPIKVLSLESSLKSDTNENGTILADIIEDETYNPERLYFENEAMKELEKIHNAQKAKELAAKREVIIREIKLLTERPASETLARLAHNHLSMKPRQIAKLILDKTYESAFADIISIICEQYIIDLSDIRKILVSHKLTAKSLKADTNSAEQVSAQISRLIYRANNYLKNNKDLR